MTQITDKELGSDDIKNHFAGMILKVGSGKGTVTVNTKTTEALKLAIQIGNGTPVTDAKPAGGNVAVEYNVTEDTYVYIYAVSNTGAAPRRAVAANGVSIYSIKVEPGVTVINGLTIQQPTEIYELTGTKVRTAATSLRGLSKGIYIIGGKKVVVK